MGTLPPSPRVLLVGGTASTALWACRALHTGYQVSVLRWQRRRTAADASACCRGSLYLGTPAQGMQAWCDRLAAFLARSDFACVVPLDELAHRACTTIGERWPVRVARAAPPAAGLEQGIDLPAALERARQSGWQTPSAQHLPRNGTPPVLQGRWVLRPAHTVTVVDDAPTVLSVREVAGAAAIEAKLRDDLPRAAVLLHRPVQGERVELLLAAAEGELLSLHPSAGAAAAGALPAETSTWAARLVASLQWTGLLRLECRRNGPTLKLLDVRCGPGDRADIDWHDAPHLVRLLLDGLLARPTYAPRRPRFDPAPALAQAAEALRATVEKVSLQVRTHTWRAGSIDPSQRLQPSEWILFVCKGNINRSLVAEHVLRAAGFARVDSAGLLAMGGRRPSAAAERFIADKLGQPVAELRSRSIDRVLRDSPSYDRIICFERRHAVELLRRYPGVRGRVQLLSQLAADVAEGIDIPDPHGGSPLDHRRCFERITRLLRLASQPTSPPLPAMAGATP
jgi:protein-tyrosine-phosphatase